MAISRIRILGLVIVLIFAGCTLFKPQLADSNKGKLLLTVGIKSYEDGDLKNAEIYIKDALAAGLDEKADKIKAHKYLAFIYCISSRTGLGGEEFKKAFELDPEFELDKAEAGHPIWGPIYRSIKAKLAIKKKSP
jgi:Tfp pilus assembly protein PilF